MKSSKRLLAICSMVVIALTACYAGTYVFAGSGQVIKVTAKMFEYNPNKITLKNMVPVTLEFTTLDRLHGFNCPDLGIRTDIVPGKVSRIQFVPKKTGTFLFHCDNFCGDGHENMTGEIIVTE